MGNFIGDLLAPKYPASFMALEQNPDWQLIQFMIAPTAVFNPFKYQDAQVDEYITEIQYGDEATQASVAKELNKYIVEQAWFAPFYRVQGSVATDANTTVEMLPTNAYPAIYDFQPKQ
jgi:peptide/nickel transport system substrate-binding protein